MSLAKIVWALSALAAIVLAFVNTGHDSAILAILGLLSGWFLSHEHRRGAIIAAIFLMMGGSSSLGGIPGLGEHLTAILASAVTNDFEKIILVGVAPGFSRIGHEYEPGEADQRDAAQEIYHRW